LKGFNGLLFSVLLPERVTGNGTIRVDGQLVAKEGRKAKLAHQGLRELAEGIGEDNHLG
jgi:hypothetical protein